MIEFYTNQVTKEKGIIFSDCGEIVMKEGEFRIIGDPNSVGVRFAAYAYNYFTKDITTLRTHMEIVTEDWHKVVIMNDISFTYYFKEKKLSYNLEWRGKESEDWLKFKSAFDRYFSLGAFL